MDGWTDARTDRLTEGSIHNIPITVLKNRGDDYLTPHLIWSYVCRCAASKHLILPALVF